MIIYIRLHLCIPSSVTCTTRDVTYTMRLNEYKGRWKMHQLSVTSLVLSKQPEKCGITSEAIECNVLWLDGARPPASLCCRACSVLASVHPSQ